jgi:arsenite methyltransferase
MKKEEVRRTVRERYGKIARQSGSSCCGGTKAGQQISPCCGTSANIAQNISKQIGYSDEELSQVPEGANLGLGCGNPVALASLKEGEVVLDLGSGAGFDCFLASSKVGKKGKVIGVDMTPDMLDKARDNARKGNYKNVEFRLGEIENLPIADSSVDAIISNCVINLSADKQRVFDEAFRVLKAGGRIMVSDIVILKELPSSIKNSIDAYIGCVAGALLKTDYVKAIKKSGFRSVKVIEESIFPLDCVISDSTAKGIADQLKMTSEQIKNLAASIASVKVSGVKPTGSGANK